MKKAESNYGVRWFKYWLRIHKIPTRKFGYGTKKNPIRIKYKNKN